MLRCKGRTYLTRRGESTIDIEEDDLLERSVSERSGDNGMQMM